MNTAEVLTPMPKLVPEELDNDDHYEIIDGVKVEMPPMSADSQDLAAKLVYHLSAYGRERNTGRACVEMLFKLPLPIDRNRKPDVAFVPFSRWPRHQPLPSTNAWNVLPDLCVEVVSPTDRADEIMDKVREYFQAGVRLVWVFYPRHALVQVYESLIAVRGLTRSDTLDGGVVLPEFRLPLSELFLLPPAAPVQTEPS